MQNYQLTVVLKNELDEKTRGGILDLIKKQFGELKKEDLWGARSLAYPIKHQDKAFFAHFEFQSEQNTIFQLDKNIKLNEDIIRYLLTKVETKKLRPNKSKSRKVVVEEKSEVEEVKEEK